MKRIHLFEFEDLSWFPRLIRDCMTRFLTAMHKIVGSEQVITNLISESLDKTNKKHIIDLCSGDTGPMLSVFERIKATHPDVRISFSDLYPSKHAQQQIVALNNPDIEYLQEPIDATKVPENMEGLRTMICSFHHMPPPTARQILQDAVNAKAPICIYEMSDNGLPFLLNWLALPITFVMTLVVTLTVRPMTWQQILFTYFIPILPLAIAWDGAISNMRTYTLSDLDELLAKVDSDQYQWEKGKVKHKGAKLFLIGRPK